MSDPAFDAMATELASTKRPAGDGSGMETNLTGIYIVPLLPVDAETAETLALSSPREAKQTFVETGVDIQEGDRLVIAGTEYPVRAVGEWDGADADYVQVFVEALKLL